MVTLRVHEIKLFWSLVAIRVVSAVFLNNSYFVPDEHWQSLEVAHRLAFGYGELTWEWKQGIRSYIYPGAISLLYRLLHFFGMDSRLALIIIPRVSQAFLSAIGDIYLYKFARLYFSPPSAVWTLVIWLGNSFSVYMAGRTLTNGVEAVMVIGILYLYPWPSWVMDRTPLPTRNYLALSVIAFFVRPTTVLISAPLIFWHFLRARRPFLLLRNSAVLCSLVSFGCIYVDRVCYGRWLVSPLNFAMFNVFQGGSAHFGSHPKLWYFYAGTPAVCGLSIPLVLLGARCCRKRHLLAIAIFYVFFHSFLAHKEFRFLYPVLPIFSMYAGWYIAERWCRPLVAVKKNDGNAEPSVSVTAYRATCVDFKTEFLAGLYIFVNFAVALYLGLLHQRGPVDVMGSLHRLTDNRPLAGIWFLMPCHSTPLYSHLHRSASLRYLHCLPNFDGVPNYVDEADEFHADPAEWLSTAFNQIPRLQQKPAFLVMYDVTVKKLVDFLKTHNFRRCDRVFHSWFYEPPRQSMYIDIYCDF